MAARLAVTGILGTVYFELRHGRELSELSPEPQTKASGCDAFKYFRKFLCDEKQSLGRTAR